MGELGYCSQPTHDDDAASSAASSGALSSSGAALAAAVPLYERIECEPPWCADWKHTLIARLFGLRHVSFNDGIQSNLIIGVLLCRHWSRRDSSSLWEAVGFNMTNRCLPWLPCSNRWPRGTCG